LVPEQEEAMSQSEEQMLRELQGSILFEPGFPKRIGYSHEQWESLAKRVPTQAYQERRQPQLEAVERTRNSCKDLVDLVRRLGLARYEPAIPTLARLWRECALVPVRTAVGHALFHINTEEAQRALESMIEDADNFSVLMAVKAVFARDPDRAYDYFENRLREAKSGSSAVAHQALWLFVPCAHMIKDGQALSEWLDPRSPDWLKRDQRWLELCARLRRDDALGDVARKVLRHADPDDMRAALERVRKAELPRRLEMRTKSSGDLLTRYRAGEFQVVWREIRAYQHIGGAFLQEVLAVAEETMRRVARNADLISGRLRAKGWKALIAEYSDLRTMPCPDNEAVFRRIVEITGSPIPPTLLVFWKIVGGINWVWDYRTKGPMPDLGVGLPMNQMDPMCIDPPIAIPALFDDWVEQKKQPDPDLIEPFSIDLAPDKFFKANFGGGGPYAVLVPFFGADPVFTHERHELPFVDYLRLAFRWAGFPGLEEHSDRQDVQRFVGVFGEGLERF
jgi:hypothetical protein